MRRHIACHDVRIDTRDADIAVGVDPLHLMPDGAAGSSNSARTRMWDANQASSYPAAASASPDSASPSWRPASWMPPIYPDSSARERTTVTAGVPPVSIHSEARITRAVQPTAADGWFSSGTAVPDIVPAAVLTVSGARPFRIPGGHQESPCTDYQA